MGRTDGDWQCNFLPSQLTPRWHPIACTQVKPFLCPARNRLHSLFLVRSLACAAVTISITILQNPARFKGLKFVEHAISVLEQIASSIRRISHPQPLSAKLVERRPHRSRCFLSSVAFGCELPVLFEEFIAHV